MEGVPRLWYNLLASPLEKPYHTLSLHLLAHGSLTYLFIQHHSTGAQNHNTGFARVYKTGSQEVMFKYKQEVHNINHKFKVHCF